MRKTYVLTPVQLKDAVLARTRCREHYNYYKGKEKKTTAEASMFCVIEQALCALDFLDEEEGLCLADNL